jgi:hypothetical protein
MELGALYATKRVAEYASQNPIFRVELSIILSRYCSGDWGELCKEDREQNDCALIAGGRIMGSYGTCAGKVWIITEWDRSATTILFPDEY